MSMTSTPRRVRGKDDVQRADQRERLPPIETEHAGDLAGRQVDGSHDNSVEEQPGLPHGTRNGFRRGAQI
jgi:hypothetical protein